MLQYCPPFPDEVALRTRLAAVGVVPGKPFDPAMLPQATQQALTAGMADGQKQIDTARAATTSSKNNFGSRQQLGTNYIGRAVGAQTGILGNTAAEATYLPYQTDATGKSLDGTQAYTLRFAPGQLPPVNAFWSLTMYDLPQQLLVANPLNRYLINSPMLPQLKADRDGGYTLYVQSSDPGGAKTSNWLPAPAGPFFAVMRCYFPKQAVLDGTWKQPPLQPAP